MGYMHIENLYKNQDILLFKECYAMEKIHGTSAHISWKDDVVHFFSGGVKFEDFVSIFDADSLAELFTALGHPQVTVFGEAYGGKCQRMSKTYGKDLRFVAFEVKIGDSWLDVPNAQNVAESLGLDFVSYVRCATDLDTLNYWRDQPSVQASKNGIEGDHKREGVVLRPIIEVVKNNGQRIISKHKADDFIETNTPRSVSKDKLEVLAEAEEIAQEWVTEMRLSHVLQQYAVIGIEQTGSVIKSMIEDVEREADGEIIESPEARRAISRRTALMFKNRLKSSLRD
jgi:hypothetical protein